jgi:hypothetical protein
VTNAPSGRFRRHRYPFHYASEYSQDGAARTASDDLTDECSNIVIARRARQCGCQLLKKLPADGATDSAGDCIANRAERVILERCPGDVAANNTSDYLNDEIDKSSRHIMLPPWLYFLELPALVSLRAASYLLHTKFFDFRIEHQLFAYD